MRKPFVAIATALSLLSASATVTFSYDELTKTLTIEGDGITNVSAESMWDDDYHSAPWNSLSDEAEKLVIGEGVTGVGNLAFVNFVELKEVVLSSTVESLGVAAFEGCKSLVDIKLPDGLKTFGNECFFGCESLTSIAIPAGVTYLPNSMFHTCKSLKSIDLGGVKEFGDGVFRYCAFESFTIPEGTKVISEAMFFSCRGLKTIDIPASVNTIEDAAFHYCMLDTINYLGETFPSLTGYQNFTMNKPDGLVTVHRINCKAYNAETVEAIQDHGGYYDTKIIPAWPKGTDVYSNSTYGDLTITPVDCETNLYKLSVDLWSSSYVLTWEGDYDLPEEDLHSTEIVVDLSEPATIIANVEYNTGGGTGGGSGIGLVQTQSVGLGTIEITSLGDQKYKLVATPDEGAEFLYWETYWDEDLLTDEQRTNPEIEVTCSTFETFYAYFTQAPYCGIDGDNLVWSVKNDTLYITGNGKMADFSYDLSPSYYITPDDYSVVVVEEGVTSIGKMAFLMMDGIEKIYLPSTLTNVGPYAFSYCNDLEKVYFAGTTPPAFDLMTYLFEGTADEFAVVVDCSSLSAYKEILDEYEVVCEDAAVENVMAGDIVVSASEGRISANRDKFNIYDILGSDVTSSNGSLASGVYIVKCDGKTIKAILK